MDNRMHQFLIYILHFIVDIIQQDKYIDLL